MTATVHQFDAHGTPADASKPVLLNVAQILRSIADCIENNDYGTVVRGVLVLRVEDAEPLLFGMGEVPMVAQSYMDLMAGAQQMMNMHPPERS